VEHLQLKIVDAARQMQRRFIITRLSAEHCPPKTTQTLQSVATHIFRKKHLSENTAICIML